MNLFSKINHVGPRLYTSYLFFAAILLAISVLSFLNMKELVNGVNGQYQNVTQPLEQISLVNTVMYQLRGDVYKYILLPELRPSVKSEINTLGTTINDQLDQFGFRKLNQNLAGTFTQLKTHWESYQKAISDILLFVDTGNMIEAEKSMADGGTASNARKALASDISNLIHGEEADAENGIQTANAIFQTFQIVLATGNIIAFLLIAVLAVLIHVTIIQPLGIFTFMALNMARGSLHFDLSDTHHQMKGIMHNEIGDLMRAFEDIRGYQLHMAEAAQNIAAGDLTVRVHVQSNQDELGMAFSQMIERLNVMVHRISENAAGLSAASQQLFTISSQAGMATNQIATTIQQITSGTSLQTESVENTVRSMDQMNRVIDGVAKGAQDQSQAVSKAMEMANQIAVVAQQISKNAVVGSKGSEQAAEVAESGSQTVSMTIEGIKTIREKVSLTAKFVEEMGTRSAQISTIVETIDDIASQTNLLALNAAIEAARAGEQGKGFAVVAEEVRKLAERASNATKEIGALVMDIQRTVSEAVRSMEDGSTEVERGVEQANQAGRALFEILKAVQEANQQMSAILISSNHMSELSDDLVESTDRVNAVVEANTAATKEMSTGSAEVTGAIENIASVIDENSASLEEVSASAEEMSAQVEEVTASAHSLSDLAEGLKQVVAQFKLMDGRDAVEDRTLSSQ